MEGETMTGKNLVQTGRVLSASFLFLGCATAFAQESGTSGAETAMPGSTGGKNPVAQQCLEKLVAFNGRMQEDGYWIAGWGSRWAYGPRPVTPVVTPPAASDEAAATAENAAPLGPWAGPRWGITSPRFQIGTLQTAVHILAHRGDEESCSATLAELEKIYDTYVGELKAAGIHPSNVTSWRQERIVAAEPVSESAAGSINIADVTGTDIRNLQDEHLGSVDDVIFDLQSGEITYVVVSTSGFLGMGEDFVAVPWNALKSTPGLNTFVLDISEQVMDQAPKVDPDGFADSASAEDDQRKVDRFWDEHIAS